MSETVVVSQLGARMHYAVPRMLHEAGRLERLYTDLCAVKGWPRVLGAVPEALQPAALRRLRGRVPGVPPERIVCFSGVGLASALRRMLVPTRAADTKAALAAGQAFSASVVRYGFGAAAGFYGISGECLEQLRAARKKGLWTAVEQMIAPRPVLDRLVEQEIVRFPNWQAAAEPDPLAEAFAERERAEWQSADIIVCPSEFVRQGVKEVGGPVERCVVVPYGVDARFRMPQRRARPAGPLRVLTVGAVGLRKGSPYVLEAARRLKRLATFRIVGPAALPAGLRAMLGEALDLAGPTPRAEMTLHYGWADVFLLPSVCEGSATVTYEALAAGLPVVTTPNAGSVVRHGVDGFVCAVGDVDALCEALALLAERPDRLEEMGEAARTGATDYDLAAYRRRLLAVLSPHEEGARVVQATG